MCRTCKLSLWMTLVILLTVGTNKSVVALQAQERFPLEQRHLATNNVDTCRNDDVGFCLYQRQGHYFQYCGDPTFGPYFLQAKADNWCHATSLETDICCGQDGAKCCEVKWNLVIGICVFFSVLATCGLCVLSCLVYVLCGRSKKVVHHVEVEAKSQYPMAYVA